MKWIRFNGEGHAGIREPVIGESGDFPGEMACGLEWPAEEDDIQEADVVTERPFGVDTHPACHAIVKGWVAKPDDIPEGLFEPPTPEERKRRTKEERDAAIRGVGLVSMDGGAASAPGESRPVRLAPGELESVDDLAFPPEPGDSGAATPAGDAVFVAPAPTARRRGKPKDDV